MEGIRITRKLIEQIENAKHKLLENKVDLDNYKIIFSKVPYIIDDVVNAKKYKTICGLPFEVKKLDKGITFLIAPKTSMWLEE